jgi:hypothetical protein
MLGMLIGFVEGMVVGGGIGYLGERAGLALGSGLWYLVFGLIGAAVGFLGGRLRPFAPVIQLLKAVVGFGVGAGLYALAQKFLPDPHLTLAGRDLHLMQAPVLGAVVGVLWALLLQVDDRVGAAPVKKTDPAS